MNTNKQNHKLLSTSRRYFTLVLIALAIIVVVSAGLMVGFFYTNNRGFLIALIVIFGVSLAVYAVGTFYSIKRIHSTYYNDIYVRTLSNVKKLTHNDTNLDAYESINIDEINDLNDATQELKKRFEGSYLIVKDLDYSNLNLEYVDKSVNLITFESFKENLRNIIFLSQSFRNVLIEVYFNLNNEELTEDDKNRLINLYHNLFKDYDHSLLMVGEANKSILIYLPVIDSFSKITETLEGAAQDSSLMVRDIKGLEHIPARYAIVAYPYSGEDYLLSDLRYAKRQNEPMNLFLPTRTQNNIDQKVLMSTSMNMNYMSKMLTRISGLNYNTVDNEKNKEMIKALMTDLSNYLDINDAGIIAYDETLLLYRPYVQTDNSSIFKSIKRVDNDFVDCLAKAADNDNSYYFSCRNHANNSLGRQLDYYGITSGYYFIVRNDENEPRAIIYFFNQHKNLYLDSYLRESLFILSLRINHYFEKRNILDYLDLNEQESEYILSMSDYMLYKCDDNFNLTYISNDIKKTFPKAKVGEKCYACYFGTDKPCYDCPVRSFKKKMISVKKDKYEISLTLNDRKSHNRALLVTKIKDENSTTGDLFNKEYLTYSYLSLFKEIENKYLSNGRGYVLLLSIDNADDFIDNQGSEGYLFVARNFIRNIKNRLKTSEVYLYNPTTIAVNFPFIGHADVINKCEQIYEISKFHYFDDGSKDQLNITYLPLGYPRGFAKADDFMKHMSDFYHSDKYDRNKDFIYFADFSISRSASKRDFMISVIESEFSAQNSTSVNLQPIVSVNDNHIYGAEILLRINDAHRNVFFNAEEISRIAEQENKTHLITESIINFAGNLYKEYGKTTFKNNNFNRIAINIDQTYLKDPNLIKGVIKLVEENNLPNNFISFEIPEDMIPDNIDRIKKFTSELRDYHIFISVDRFTGEFIGGEKLKELGFNEIKISRSLILKIDKDPIRYNEVADIINNAHKAGISVAAVGVENEAQYKALKGLDKDMLVQGYFLYKPLTRSDLISAIVSYN